MSRFRGILFGLAFLATFATAERFPSDLQTFECGIAPLTQKGIETAINNRNRFAEACLACVGNECAMRIWPADNEEYATLCRNSYCLPRRVNDSLMSVGPYSARIRAQFEISQGGQASLRSAHYASGVPKSYIDQEISDLDRSRVKRILRSFEYLPLIVGGKRKSLVNIEATIPVSSMVNAPNTDDAPKREPRAQEPSTRANELVPASSGSGFFVSNEGHLITNNHVVEHCSVVKLKRDGRVENVTVISRDQVNDLALLKSDSKNSSTIPISRSNPELLQDVYAAGFPFGSAVSSSVKITKGIVSSLSGIANNFSNVQIDAALQPGNSGGPIVDDYGNAVAVAVAKLDLARFVEVYGVVPENTNFGIKASVVRNLLDANGVRPTAPNSSRLSGSELGRKITAGTVHLSCLMTMTQIQKVKKQKVLFSKFR